MLRNIRARKTCSKRVFLFFIFIKDIYGHLLPQWNYFFAFVCPLPRHNYSIRGYFSTITCCYSSQGDKLLKSYTGKPQRKSSSLHSDPHWINSHPSNCNHLDFLCCLGTFFVFFFWPKLDMKSFFFFFFCQENAVETINHYCPDYNVQISEILHISKSQWKA